MLRKPGALFVYVETLSDTSSALPARQWVRGGTRSTASMSCAHWLSCCPLELLASSRPFTRDVSCSNLRHSRHQTAKHV